jgi:hypothetical protein
MLSTFNERDLFPIYHRPIYLLMPRKITSVDADSNGKQLSLPIFAFKALTIGLKISTSLKTVIN